MDGQPSWGESANNKEKKVSKHPWRTQESWRESRSGGKLKNRQYERCHAETLGQAKGMIERRWKAYYEGLSGLDIVLMEHLLNKSGEAQLRQEGPDVANTATMERAEKKQWKQFAESDRMKESENSKHENCAAEGKVRIFTAAIQTDIFGSNIPLKKADKDTRNEVDKRDEQQRQADERTWFVIPESTYKALTRRRLSREIQGKAHCVELHSNKSAHYHSAF